MARNKLIPVNPSLGDADEIRAQLQAFDAALLGKNLLGDPTGLCWPEGDAMGPGTQWGHWNCSGGAGATVNRLTGKANTYLESNDADVAMCFRISWGTSVTRLYQTLLSTTTFLDRWQSKTFSLVAAVKASALNQARLFLQSDAALSDPADYSAYHSGGGDWERLEVTLTTEAAADRLIFGIENDANGNVDVDACVMVIGPVPPDRFVPAQTVVGSLRFPMDGTISTAHGPAADGINFARHPFWRPAIVRDTQLHVVGDPAGATIIVDVNHDGTSMYATEPSIAIAANAGSRAPEGTYRRRCFNGISGATTTDAVLSVDLDQVGSDPGVDAGTDLTVLVRALQWNRPLEAFLGHDEVG